MDSDLRKQLSFSLEIDKLKTILRQTLLTDSSRQENTAEHSWHLGILAFLLAERAPEKIDVLRTVKMCLVHDIVEIDAGDTFAYDAAGYQDKEAREQQAATRIFGLLPEKQAAELRALWDEFEDAATPESRYANALDRLQPLLNNWKTEGGTWRIHKIRRSQVYKRMDPVRTGLPDAWPMVVSIIEEATAKGWIAGE
jgi:putative hydrolase of HD superfamily